MFDRLIERGFVVFYQSHAEAILEKDFPDAAAEIERAIADIEVLITEIIGYGGGEAKVRSACAGPSQNWASKSAR